MFGRGKRSKTTVALQAPEVEEQESPGRDTVLAEAADALDAVLTKVYDDAYRRAVDDMLVTLRERVEELREYGARYPEDAYPESFLDGLLDAIVVVEHS